MKVVGARRVARPDALSPPCQAVTMTLRSLYRDSSPNPFPPSIPIPPPSPTPRPPTLSPQLHHSKDPHLTLTLTLTYLEDSLLARRHPQSARRPR